MDALGVGRALLVGHDWGGFVGYRMVLAAPEQFDSCLVCNMAHPWQTPARRYRTSGASRPISRSWRQRSPATAHEVSGRVIFRLPAQGSGSGRAAAKGCAERFPRPGVRPGSRRHLPRLLLRIALRGERSRNGAACGRSRSAGAVRDGDFARPSLARVARSRQRRRLRVRAVGALQSRRARALVPGAGWSRLAGGTDGRREGYGTALIVPGADHGDLRRWVAAPLARMRDRWAQFGRIGMSAEECENLRKPLCRRRSSRPSGGDDEHVAGFRDQLAGGQVPPMLMPVADRRPLRVDRTGSAATAAIHGRRRRAIQPARRGLRAGDGRR